MEQHDHGPESKANLPTIRHDGWTGERIATFLEVLDALRAGGTAAVAAALDAKPDKPDTPPPPGIEPDGTVWQAPDGSWMTTFPPPPGFDGRENVPFDGWNYYERACTPEEAELLGAHQAAVVAAERAELLAEAEAERDGYFALLRAELPAGFTPSAASGSPE